MRGTSLFNNEDFDYRERVTSIATESLFVAMTGVFLLLFIWRKSTTGFDFPAAASFCLFLFFLFYSVNYRTLAIFLNRKSIRLKFGIFSCSIPLDNIEAVRLDNISGFLKWGGAGIHFMFVGGRYRASFNFLQHPRILLSLKRKVGPVQDISFSSRHPVELIRSLNQAAASRVSAEKGGC
jgi:hypothetical protein